MDDELYQQDIAATIGIGSFLKMIGDLFNNKAPVTADLTGIVMETGIDAFGQYFQPIRIDVISNTKRLVVPTS